MRTGESLPAKCVPGFVGFIGLTHCAKSVGTLYLQTFQHNSYAQIVSHALRYTLRFAGMNPWQLFASSTSRRYCFLLRMVRSHFTARCWAQPSTGYSGSPTLGWYLAHIVGTNGVCGFQLLHPSWCFSSLPPTLLTTSGASSAGTRATKILPAR